MNKLKNHKINVIVSFGTRPEGIKLAPVIKNIEKHKDKFNLTVCSTGQHKEMLDQVLNFFELKPDIFLNLMTEDQSLSSLSSRLLNKMDELLSRLNPDILLVQGDTSTAFFTALSAFYKKIKIGHVEAGLRTYDKYNPFPEEINRQMISRIADLNFVPTKKAFDNMIGENTNPDNVFLTGNTIVDAILWSLEKTRANREGIESSELFKKLDNDKKIILVTMHRRESFGKDMKNICNALKFVANNYKNIQIVYPVHLNPNVRKPVFQILSQIKNIVLTDPLNYESFIWLMNRSYFIVTDSGGIQEEAPTLKKPVLVIRKRTERTESVEMGVSKLIGIEKDAIIKNISELINNEYSYNKMIADSNPYGDGHASERISEIIFKYFST